MFFKNNQPFEIFIILIYTISKTYKRTNLKILLNIYFKINILNFKIIFNN